MSLQRHILSDALLDLYPGPLDICDPSSLRRKCLASKSPTIVGLTKSLCQSPLSLCSEVMKLTKRAFITNGPFPISVRVEKRDSGSKSRTPSTTEVCWAESAGSKYWTRNTDLGNRAQGIETQPAMIGKQADLYMFTVLCRARLSFFDSFPVTVSIFDWESDTRSGTHQTCLCADRCHSFESPARICRRAADSNEVRATSCPELGRAGTGCSVLNKSSASTMASSNRVSKACAQRRGKRS